MSTQDLEARLRNQPTPEVPPSEPPSMEWLDARLARSRKKRRLQQAAVSATGVAALLLAIPLMRSGSVERPKAKARQLVAVDDPVEVVVDAPATIQVFATVRDQVPIFGLDGETKILRHVGWMESEQTLPVDLSGFTADQQEQFQAVLNDNDTTFSL